MRYLIDTHTHTIASGHAYNTIDEMTRKANSIGLENLAITEHTTKMPGSCNMLYFTNLKILPERKYDVNRLFGCEANIVNLYGEVDMPFLYIYYMSSTNIITFQGWNELLALFRKKPKNMDSSRFITIPSLSRWLISRVRDVI